MRLLLLINAGKLPLNLLLGFGIPLNAKAPLQHLSQVAPPPPIFENGYLNLILSF